MSSEFKYFWQKSNRKVHFLLPALVLVVLLACQSKTPDFKDSQQLTEVKPEEVGLSSQRLARIDAVIEQYVNNKWIPGAVALVARHGKIAYFKNFGTREMDGVEVLRKDDIFRIASMTKAVTTVAVMMLYEEGKFLLDDPVSKYIPEFRQPKVLLAVNEEDSSFTSKAAKEEVTIRHLLTHTSGLGYGSGGIYEKAGVPVGFVSSSDILADKMKILVTLPLLHEPGEKWTYGLSTDFLGYLVEVLSGKTLDAFFQERIFKPLGMNDIHFFLPDEKVDRLVPVYPDVENENAEEYVLEVSKYPYEGGKSYYSGGSGLSSTALDYAKFIQMLLNNGSYNNVRLLSRKTIDLMTMNQVGDLLGDGAFGLGFGITTEEDNTRKLGSVGNYRWGGYFSTIFWIDPEEDLIAVLMKQILDSKHEDLHDKFEVLTYQAIID